MAGIKRVWLRRIWKMDIHPTVQMSLSVRFDLTEPGGIHVSAQSYIAFDAQILSHDMTRNFRAHTRIGASCFIGGRSLILPGVTIGDRCRTLRRSPETGASQAGSPRWPVSFAQTIFPISRGFRGF